MRRLAFLIAVISSGPLAIITPDRAAASVSIGVDINMFRDSLSPYGDWVVSDSYGTVWAPRHVSRGWRPYTRGHWVYTDYDWTWASDDDWGWATDHYGRWAFDPGYGWIWVPGSEWAPAWVAWRSGGGYIGWAPLPPRADAFRFGFDFGIDAHAYSFVETRHFCEPRVYNHYVPVARNVTVINVTQNITNYTVVDNRIINRGIDVRRIERATGHAVPRSRLREVASPRDARGGHIERGQIAVFRPHVTPERADGRHDARAFEPRVQPAPRRAPVVTDERRHAQDRRLFDSARQRDRSDRVVAQPRFQERQRAERAPSPVVVAEPHRQPRSLDRDHVRELRPQAERAPAKREARERQAVTQRQKLDRRAVAAPSPEPSAEKRPKHGHH